MDAQTAEWYDNMMNTVDAICRDRSVVDRASFDAEIARRLPEDQLTVLRKFLEELS